MVLAMRPTSPMAHAKLEGRLLRCFIPRLRRPFVDGRCLYGRGRSGSLLLPGEPTRYLPYCWRYW